MRALRDFNMPKIVTDDVPVFLGLVSDLFPALGVPRRRAPHFEQMVRQSTLELRLQPEESFVLKVKGARTVMAALGICSESNCLIAPEPEHELTDYTDFI